LKVLEKILENADGIMEGKKKGPEISVSSILQLCNLSFGIANRRYDH